NTPAIAQVSGLSPEPAVQVDTDPAVQVDTQGDTRPTGVDTRVDTPAVRLDPAAARAAIVAAYQEGLSVRQAAGRATRSRSWVQAVYTELALAACGQHTAAA
uniref:hypothetical protein n=1 Tax=Candidatus Frankia alpina TaxID=2699483 RepID=UPI00196710BE